jgi:hypothetical protein
MRALLFSVLVLSFACGPAPKRSDRGDDDDDDEVDAAVVTQPEPQRCQKIDVLFVIDNSQSMTEEQTNLIANFPQFISVLDASGLDYRVAVTTTGRDYRWREGPFSASQSGGDNGTLLKPATCAMTNRWLDKADPDVGTAFSCVANVGTSGPSREMPLGAMRDAFEERIADGTNAGFHRPDALLGVVFLTDEEDCSYERSEDFGLTGTICSSKHEPVANYVTFLDTFTGNRSRWAIAAIAGPGPGSCMSAFGSAAEAKRIKQFVQLTGANGVMSSICDGDLAAGLATALDLFQSACGDIIL